MKGVPRKRSTAAARRKPPTSRSDRQHGVIRTLEATTQTGVDSKPPSIHVLVRVRSESGQTISAHAEVAATRGAAVLGKIGQAVGPKFREELNRQIASGVRTYLFLTTREGWNGPYVTYRCPLRRVHDELPSDKRALVPPYYMGESARIATWFEISGVERLSREEMNRIYVVSSRREIMSVIASTAAVFRVACRA